MTKYRKKPVEVEAIQWTGDNETDLKVFTKYNFEALSDYDRVLSDDPAATAEVYDVLHSTWVLVQTGDYIIKGIQGEFYPCREDQPPRLVSREEKTTSITVEKNEPIDA